MAKVYTKRRKCCCMSRTVKNGLIKLVVVSERIFFKNSEPPVTELFISNVRQVTIDVDTLNDLPNTVKVNIFPDLDAFIVTAEVDVIIDGRDYHLSTVFEYTEKMQINIKKPYISVSDFSLTGVSRSQRQTNTGVSYDTCITIIEALLKALKDEKVIK